MSDILHSPMAAKVVAGATTATGLEALLFKFIPQGLSMTATLLGIILSIVFIINNWQRGKLERTKLVLDSEHGRLENEKLRLEIKRSKESEL